jgi:hypothetical protein
MQCPSRIPYSPNLFSQPDAYGAVSYDRLSEKQKLMVLLYFGNPSSCGSLVAFSSATTPSRHIRTMTITDTCTAKIKHVLFFVVNKGCYTWIHPVVMTMCGKYLYHTIGIFHVETTMHSEHCEYEQCTVHDMDGFWASENYETPRGTLGWISITVLPNPDE